MPDALNDYTEAIKKDPNNIKRYLSRAKYNAKERQYDKVIDDCNLMKDKEADSDNYFELGNLWLKVGNRDKAADCFENAVNLSDEDERSGTLVISYIALSEWKKAIEILDKAIENSDKKDDDLESGIYYSLRSFVNKMLGKDADERLDFNKASKLLGSEIKCQYYLSNFLSSTPQYDLAITELTKLINKDEIEESTKIEVYAKRGKLHYEIGNYEKALADFENTLKIDPKNNSSRNYLNRTKMHLNEKYKQTEPHLVVSTVADKPNINAPNERPKSGHRYDFSSIKGCNNIDSNFELEKQKAEILNKMLYKRQRTDFSRVVNM